MSEHEKTENIEDILVNSPENIMGSEDQDIQKDVSKEQSPDTDPGIETDPLAEAEKKLELAQQEAKQENERFLRLYADFENYKKRSAREIQDFRKFANDALIKELLPVLDNLERAIDSSNAANEESDKSIAQGVDMTLKEILKILEKFHVKPVDAIGKPFDPNFHEAIGQEETQEYEDNIVIKEFQKGYLLHDRLIRPAMVMVSKYKQAPPEDEPENNNNKENE
ncbi:HSP-70 cofactor [Desulfonema limicola]|uniref:Protein GrpE n=1 Tax=Desulfonema limicola TaxID=45656 RepID=A0A975B4F2_9BACT|nr:nucleotide exchange factor GrpE [Desulfonema limicola]QTA78610.1 HSP-70 cofactor [Desulfonema limicola]